MRSLIDKKKATELYNQFKEGNSGKYHKVNILPLDEWLQQLDYAITRKGGDLSQKNFGEGIPAETIEYPTAYDVLAGITKNDPYTFESFCGDYGYDTDSRQAEKTYNAVCEEWANISKLFTPEQIEQLQEIN